VRVLIISILLAFIQGIKLDAQLHMSVTSIEDSLIEGSSAVIRFHHTRYERTALDRYEKTIHYAVTVLNTEGEDMARLRINYDRNSEVSEIQGKVYNELGIETGKLKKKDIEDYANNASFTLFSDDRVKTAAPAINGFPYTVEYNYTVKYKQVVGFPTWMPLPGFQVSCQNADLEIRTPKKWGLRHMELNGDFNFTEDHTEDVSTYRWSMSGLKPVVRESGLPNYLDFMPAVYLTPLDIAYETSTGSFNSWQDYGFWVYGLIQGRDIIPENRIQELRLMTDTISIKRDKVKAVYQYMQARTRYVNVSLGIGGFQPITAAEVDQKGYGDCKALTNYTRALLKSVGIKSFYAEIGSGSNRELKYPDFASVYQTNHVILCVPDESDTIWLECTSQTIPFGYIGKSNSDRYALLVTENGGVLARTTKYEYQGNRRESRTHVKLDPQGNARVSVSTEFRNGEFEAIDGLLSQSHREQQDALLEYLPMEGFQMESLNLEQKEDNQAVAQLDIVGTVGRLAVKAGTRLLIRPTYNFSYTNFGQLSENRAVDYHVDVGYVHQDSFNISIPEGYTLEKLPEDVSLEACGGSYQLTYRQKENAVFIYRKLSVYSGTYTKSQFEDINTFRNTLNRADRKRIVLKVAAP